MNSLVEALITVLWTYITLAIATGLLTLVALHVLSPEKAEEIIRKAKAKTK